MRRIQRKLKYSVTLTLIEDGMQLGFEERKQGDVLLCLPVKIFFGIKVLLE